MKIKRTICYSWFWKSKTLNIDSLDVRTTNIGYACGVKDCAFAWSGEGPPPFYGKLSPSGHRLDDAIVHVQRKNNTKAILCLVNNCNKLFDKQTRVRSHIRDVDHKKLKHRTVALPNTFSSGSLLPNTTSNLVTNLSGVDLASMFPISATSSTPLPPVDYPYLCSLLGGSTSTAVSSETVLIQKIRK